VRDKMLSSPDFFVRWTHNNGSFVANGSICQNFASGCFNNMSRLNNPAHRCPFVVRAAAYNWIRNVDVAADPQPLPDPAVLSWYLTHVINRTLRVADGAWIDGDGPDNGAWMCSGGTGPRHKTEGNCPATGCALTWAENTAFQYAERLVVHASHEWLLARGGYDYRCLRFVNDVPTAADSPSSCSAKLHALAFQPNATSANGTVSSFLKLQNVNCHNTSSMLFCD
jgi:hypothetical protein